MAHVFTSVVQNLKRAVFEIRMWTNTVFALDSVRIVLHFPSPAGPAHSYEEVRGLARALLGRTAAPNRT